MEGEIIGAIKIKDGLFIGDQYAAKDMDFIVTNKVTHIINCAGRQFENCWESFGVVYLTFNWTESETQSLFDTRDAIVNEIYNFVEEAVEVGESVLIHSMRGQSRACCVIAAYFMKRFNWTLYKTLEFLNSRRPNLEIRANFFHQLTDLESRMIKNGARQASANWTDAAKIYDSDEILITNTFLNAKNAPVDEHLMNPNSKVLDLQQKINWNEALAHHFPNPPNKQESSKKELVKTNVRSILKGSKKIFKFDTGEEVREFAHRITDFNGSSTLGGTSKLNRSSKSLLNNDGRFDRANLPKTFSMTMGNGSKTNQFNENNIKNTPSNPKGSLVRSSSASAFERAENPPLGEGRKSGLVSSEKLDLKASKPNGSSQLTYNNYMLLENSNSTYSTLNSKTFQPNTQKMDLKSKEFKEDNSAKENKEFTYTSSATRNSFKREDSNQTAQDSLSYTTLKLANDGLEKKNSLEVQKFDKRAEDQDKYRGSNKFLERPYTPSSDLDQHSKKAQLNQKNRETNSVSPLLRRDENAAPQNKFDVDRKRADDSKGASTKIEASSPHLSYLNGLYTSKLSSDMYSNSKALSEIKNTNSQTNEINSRLQYQNYLTDSLKDTKTSGMMNRLVGTNKLATPFNLNSTTEKSSSNAILGQRNAPIKATYEIPDRPKSALLNNKTTGPFGMSDSLTKPKDIGTNPTRPGSASNQVRSYSPSVKSSNALRKESPVRGQSPHEKVRQRSSSPVQMKPYSTVYLGPGPFKPKWKF